MDNTRTVMFYNDGSVKGHGYFCCKPSHGLFVKPEKATHRGINCSNI
ncbi:CAP-Gly domain-containing linker protein 4, partial [Geodia barretti]